MNRPLRLVAVLALTLTAAVGCRGTVPVRNVTDNANPIGKPVTIDQVTQGIISAGAGLGWDMKVVSPGKIIGTLNIRSHTAVVEIPYTTQSYSIIYSSSENLKYDAEDNTIHPNYNSWVQNLSNAIRSKLAMI
jgi:hypothetical protein